MTQLRYLKDVVSLALDVKKCVGCGMCRQVCPHGVFGLEDQKARIIDHDACMECGACAGNCPSQALSVNAGVGCAAGLITTALRGSSQVATCGGCSDDSSSCCP